MGIGMRRRNWWLILPLSAVLGYVAFRFWGALVAPLVAVIALAALDGRRRNRLEVENARLASFLEANAPGTPPKLADPAVPTVDTANAIPGAASEPPLRPVRPVLPARTVPVSRSETLERSVALALRGNDPALAVALMREWQELPSTAFGPAELARLSEAALAAGEFFVAGCLAESTAARRGDVVAAQKALLEYAGRAVRAGSPGMARGLYERLISVHPASPFVSFARASMDRLV